MLLGRLFTRCKQDVIAENSKIRSSWESSSSPRPCWWHRLYRSSLPRLYPRNGCHPEAGSNKWRVFVWIPFWSAQQETCVTWRPANQPPHHLPPSSRREGGEGRRGGGRWWWRGRQEERGRRGEKDHPHWDHSPSIRPFHTLWTWNNRGLIAAVCLRRAQRQAQGSALARADRPAEGPRWRRNRADRRGDAPEDTSHTNTPLSLHYPLPPLTLFPSSSFTFLLPHSLQQWFSNPSFLRAPPTCAPSCPPTIPPTHTH